MYYFTIQCIRFNLILLDVSLTLCLVCLGVIFGWIHVLNYLFIPILEHAHHVFDKMYDSLLHY
jgi:hypothetical protein